MDDDRQPYGTLAPEIVELAKSKGFEFVDTDPQLNYPDALDTYRKEMDENGWEYGDDDEELFELAMHDRQYRDYKSGVAKKRFEDDLQRAKDAAMAKNGYSEEEIKKLKRASALGGFRRRSFFCSFHRTQVPA